MLFKITFALITLNHNLPVDNYHFYPHLNTKLDLDHYNFYDPCLDHYDHDLRSLINRS